MDRPIRDRKTAATRARIADTALDLFVAQGYAETSIDQIASAAGVGRRTVFRHFTTKEAMLFDHLVIRREMAVARLEERPADEAPLVSLHAVLRQLCEEGYERRLLDQIRAVLAIEPGLMGEEVALTVRAFQRSVIGVLERRSGPETSKAHIRALTLMAFSWVEASARTYLIEARPSMVECYDDVVAACVAASAGDLAAALAVPRDGDRTLAEDAH